MAASRISAVMHHKASTCRLESFSSPSGVNWLSNEYDMQDLRMRFADRTERGQFNARRGDGANVVRLEPTSHEVIVGFYRTSGSRDGVWSLRLSLVRRAMGWKDDQVLYVIFRS